MDKRKGDTEAFKQEIGRKEDQKMKWMNIKKKSIWSGFAFFGLVGWSIVVPTLAGTALGIWLDKNYPHSSVSWTLTFLIAGLIAGCMSAWHWIDKEHKEMNKQNKNE